MSREQPITRAADWHRYEAQVLTIAVDTDATMATLRWVLLDRQGGAVLLEKTGDGMDPPVVGGETSVAITIDADTDYTDLEAGVYFHELWDSENADLLAWGDAVLLDGTEPAL